MLTIFWTIFKQGVPLDAFKAFLGGSIFNKDVFCFKDKRGLLLNDECSSWYNRVGIFMVSVGKRRKVILDGDGSSI